MTLMLNGTLGRLARKRREAADKEINKLVESVQRLDLNCTVPLRVRLALRAHERTQRRGSLIATLHGFVAGAWWPMPVILLLDTRPGSMRDLAGKLTSAAVHTITHTTDPSVTVSELLRIILCAIFLAAFYGAISLAPTILGVRVGLGFAGFPTPGRKNVLIYRRSLLTYYCSDALVACAVAINKRGERRIEALQKVGSELRYVHTNLRTVHRFTKGFARRGRRKSVKMHALRVSGYLAKLEESTEEMTDSDLKELGRTLLHVAEKCADGDFGNLVNEELIADVAVPDRESARLTLTALTAIAVAATTLYTIDAFKLPSSLEGIAVSGSVLLTAGVSYGRKALQKIDQIRGITGQ
ncbi:hypothetical protein [Streptomyces sp. bgisy130]|uniref:hypothetical protein n=1 Tax=Streptomyces sp. bgisy130 TaxID=3413788 RepID=UPI003F4A5CA8